MLCFCYFGEKNESLKGFLSKPRRLKSDLQGKRRAFAPEIIWLAYPYNAFVEG
ncbi:hypothetical protein Barb7_02773 [Bacteroidales bacterium Barb7]|nr:hypothetical protein Barb7_02773 [Bacteroidales bacterium Barb7]